MQAEKLKKQHLPQYDEIYQKVRNRIGKIIVKYKKQKKGNSKRTAIQILDTAYQVIESKLSLYREFYEGIASSDELKIYISTVMGDEALNTAKYAAYLGNRIRNLWLGLRRDMGYAPERGREISQALKCVSRLLSYIKRKRKLLEKVLEIKKEISLMPGLLEYPRLVIVGPPNAGKSSLAIRISSASPRIADYPFTTKALVPGIASFMADGKSVIVLDTPGILFRESEVKRNVIERRALAAIKLPKVIVVFVIDPFSYIMSLDEQLSVLYYVININPNVIVAVNKVDIDRDAVNEAIKRVRESGLEPVPVSALTGEGVERLLFEILRLYASISEKSKK